MRVPAAIPALTSLHGHAEAVTSVALSASGDVLAAGFTINQSGDAFTVVKVSGENGTEVWRQDINDNGGFSNEATVVGNRGLKVSIRDAAGDASRRCVGYLNQVRPVEKKNLRVAVRVCAERIIFGSEGDERTVLRNGRRHCSSATHLKERGRIDCDIRANCAKVIAAAGARNILVPNVSPGGLVPLYNDDASTATALNAAAAQYRSELNTDLDAAIATLAGEGITITLYRLDAYSLGYRLASIIAGGPSPFIAAWLFSTYQSSLPIAVYILLCGVIGFVAAAMLTDYTNKDISEEYEGV